MPVPPSVKSAWRIFEILELFKEQQEPLRLSDVAERLQYPISSTSALFKTMLHQGYLQVDPGSRCYFPSQRLAQLVNWMGGGNPERGPALAAMRRLQKRTSGQIVLGTEVDLYIEYVEILGSGTADDLYIPAGIRRLLVQNGMGWLILSRMSEAAVISLYCRTIAAQLLHEREFSQKALLARVDRLREQDFALAHAGEYVRKPSHWSYAMISMLVPSASQKGRMAIGVLGPATRIDRDRGAIVDELRKEMTRLVDTV